MAPSSARIIPEEQRQRPWQKVLEKSHSDKDERHPCPAASRWVLLDPKRICTAEFHTQHLLLGEGTSETRPKSMWSREVILISAVLTKDHEVPLCLHLELLDYNPLFTIHTSLGKGQKCSGKAICLQAADPRGVLGHGPLSP